MAKVAINGLGRIGRATLKIVMDTPGLDLVAANDIGASDSIAYLLKYDTVYGRYEKTVETTDDGTLTIGKQRLTLLREENPARLPWKSLDVDIVFECTGAFTRRQDLDAHIRAGARYVILSAPSKSDDVETIVHGVNTPQGATAIISCASCTTNCITPGDGDSRAPDRRQEGHHDHGSRVHRQSGHRRRSTQERPERPGRRREFCAHVDRGGGCDGQGAPRISRPIRRRSRPGACPCRVARRHRRPRGRATTVDEVNRVFTEEAESERYRGVLGVTTDPVVSSDIIKDSRASVVDLGMSQVVDGDLVKVMSWYDNEWGYSSQLVREALRIAREVRK